LLRSQGVDPARLLLAEGEGSTSWLVKAHTALVVISVFEVSGQGYLRITSPIVYVPADRREHFYRRLLDLNSEMVSAALATVGDVVHVVSVRPLQDLDPTEADDLIRRVCYYADMLLDRLGGEFGAQPWELDSTP
ncbi:MAG TPA: YbjN domain-containing protein, partial [Candidatus Nitrosotenuis sp.]|nr:YbjN domain-containing protein [Candidatus Nitrosotenuis sp.]